MRKSIAQIVGKVIERLFGPRVRKGIYINNCVIGLLDDIPTVTGETIVTPVVGVLDGMPELVANPAEVARIFSIPLAVLSSPNHWRVEETTYNGRQYPLYFLEHSGETLWGLSAYVTRQLLQCMGRLEAS